MSNKKAIVSLSGGMDSSTVVGLLIEKGYTVLPVHFQYGSKHNQYEKQAMYQLVSHYDIPVRVIDMSMTFKHMTSNLLKSGGEIPEGHYEESNMSLTVIPGRNTIFTSVMMGIAQSENADLVVLGTHLGDHAVYPDCRKEFIEAMQKVVDIASEGTIRLDAPFITADKAEICKVGLDIDLPYEYTRTCYKDQPISCGRCGSCVERLEAFYKNGVEDPIEYEDRTFFRNVIKGEASK